MSDREDDLLDQRHAEVITAISGVHERLDLLNGRTRKLEQRVSVLSWAYTAGAAALSFLSYKLFGHQ